VAAEIIGISDRSLRTYEEFGYDGLFDRRKKRQSLKRGSQDGGASIAAIREKYFDFNVRHFHEKLVEEHGITLSYTRVKNVAGSRPGGQTEAPRHAPPA